jgi:hypothetical protein
MVKGKCDATGILSLVVMSVAKLYFIMNATISSWSVVKFAFGIYMSFPFTLYKILKYNALPYIYFFGKLARISLVWIKVNPVMSAINVSSASNLKESI